MKTKKIYKKLAGTFVLTIGMCLGAHAQDSLKIGDYGWTPSNAILDRSLFDTLHQNLFQLVHPEQADTVFWRYIIKGDNVQPVHWKPRQNYFLDTSGSLVTGFARISGKWHYSDFSFVGIREHNGALSIDIYGTPSYEWYFNDKICSDSLSSTLGNLQSGTYKVVVKWNSSDPKFSGQTATFTKYYNSGVSSDISNSFTVTDLIEHFGINYKISDKYQPQSIKWVYKTSHSIDSVISYNSTIQLLNDGTLRAYVLQNGSWYTQFETFNYADNETVISQDLMIQNGLMFTINQEYKPSSYFWKIVDPSYPNDTITNNKPSFYSPFVTLSKDVDIMLRALINGKWYTQKKFIRNVNYTGAYVVESLFNTQTVQDLISQNGLHLTISSQYQPDSIIWMNYRNTQDTTDYTFGKSISLTRDVIYRAYVHQNGQWFTQKSSFKGISFDSAGTGTLSAPVIQNATYTWYQNGQLLTGVSTSNYVPTENGTYKVVIIWSINARLEAATDNSASFEFKVTSFTSVTGLANAETGNNLLSVYPNPANGFVNLSVLGDFEYKIENTNAYTVISGTASNAIQLDINSLSVGLYYVYIKSANKQSVKKFVIQ